jgi:hypothetical protein
MLSTLLVTLGAVAQQTETWDLEPTRPRYGQFFGMEVDLAGDLLAAAALYDGPLFNDPLLGPGAVHVYERAANGWSWHSSIDCPDPANAPRNSFARGIALGSSVIAIADTLRTISGGQSQAPIWIYELQGEDWVQRPRLEDPRNLGYGPWLSLSGDRLAITSVLTPGQTPVGPFEVGAVDIYERVQGTWTLADTLMPVDFGPLGRTRHFGLNVQLHGDLLIAGCDVSSAYSHLCAKGEVRVFERAGGVWHERQVLQRPSCYERSEFGRHGLALDDEWVMVGDPPRSGPGVGGGPVQPPRVYAYRRGSQPGDPWTLFQVLSPSVWFVTQTQADRFGFSVALSGDRLVVGAPYAPGGHNYAYYGQAWVFEFDGSAWVETQRLSSTEVEQRAHPGGFLGWSVDIDGPYIAAGDCYAPAGDPPTFQIGKAYVYENGIGTPTCVGAPNHLGVPATLTARGSDHAHLGFVDFIGASFPAASAGLLLAGPLQHFVPNPGGSAGNLCIGGPLRLGHRSADAQGNWSYAFELPAPGASGPNVPAITPGTTWHFQAWYRQPANPPTSNFTGALAVTFR